MGPFDNFPSYEDNKRFTIGNFGMSTGNPAIDMAMMTAMGRNIGARPIPGSNQGIFDAYQMRERNMQFLQSSQAAFGNNLLFQKLGGVNQSSLMFQGASMLARDPDSIIWKGIAPLIGGNPVRAQMGLFANLSGQAMGAFGRLDNIGVSSTTDMMNDLYGHFYNQRAVSGADIAKQRSTALTTGQSILRGRGDLMGQFQSGLNNRGEFEKFRGEQSALIQLTEGLGSIKDKSKLDEFGKSIIDALTSQDSKEKIKRQWGEALSAGATEGIKKLGALSVGNFNSLSDAGLASLRMSDLAGKTTPTSINLQNTRGFKLEDFTEFFTGSADFRLMKKGEVNKNFNSFLQGAPGVMDAARGLFGNDKSGNQLASEINNLLGASFYDLADQSSSKKLEDLQRNIKAAAKTAGISVEAILGIIDQGKQLAAMHPQLQYLGGGAISGMATRSVAEASAMSAYFGNDYVRRMGGNVGLTQVAMTGSIQAASQPLTLQLAALDDLASQRNNEGARRAIADYAAGRGDLPLTSSGYIQFLNRYSRMMGTSVYNTATYAQSAKGAQARGLANNPELAEAGNLSVEQELMRNIHQLDPHAPQRLAAAMRSGEYDPSQIESILGPIVGPQMDSFLTQNAGAVLSMWGRYDPGLIKKKREELSRVAENQKFAAMMSAKYGYLNAPAVTGIFNQIMNGAVGKDGLSALLEPLGLNGMSPELMSSFQSMIDVKYADSPEQLVDVLNRNGGHASKTVIKGMVDSKLSYEEIRKFGGVDGRTFLQHELNNPSHNQALNGYASSSRYKDLQAMFAQLSQMDPDGTMSGAVSLNSLSTGAARSLYSSYRNSVIKPALDRTYSDFIANTHQPGEVGKGWDILKKTNPGAWAPDEVIKLLGDKNTQAKLSEGGVGSKAIAQITQQAQDTIEKINDIKMAGVDKTEKNPAQDTNELLKKILSNLGGEDGGLGSALSNLTDAVRKASQT